MAAARAVHPTTIADLAAGAARRLAAADVASPRADARWIVLHALGLSAAELTRDGRRRPTPDQVVAVDRLVDRRVAREPLQLILGETAFRGHRLLVRPGVFIPRPETELLVELALSRLPAGDAMVVEPCTGTGAIACAIALERPGTRVMATDIADAAVALAADNARALGADVDVRRGDLLDPVPAAWQRHVDLLVANPPYLRPSELDELPVEVARWDPYGALVAGPSGHEAFDALAGLALSWLRPGGWLVVELDERRVDEAAQRAAQAGLVAVEASDDLAGRPRFVRGQRP